MNLYYMINECYNKYYNDITIEERKKNRFNIFNKLKIFNSYLYLKKN